MLNLNDDPNGLEPGGHPGSTCHFKRIDDPEELANWKEFYRTGRIDIEWLNKRNPPSSNAFRLATRCAIAAYEKSGRMVDAALGYARFGIPVFPCGLDRKRPIPARDRGPDGEPISGTGGVYKATTDPEQIRNWWTGRKQYLIAVPMGPRSGVWALDVDTAEDHADGTASWNTLLAQHEPFVTREHRSATGGPHVIFAWDPERPIGCSKGGLPSGIEVKGQGGYIVVPPSRRKGRAYQVFRDSEPIVAPDWIYDLIYEGRPPHSGSGGGAERDASAETVHLDAGLMVTDGAKGILLAPILIAGSMITAGAKGILLALTFIRRLIKPVVIMPMVAPVTGLGHR
jgi:Bifunctional DNA primase/polymerase, N-terminal